MHHYTNISTCVLIYIVSFTEFHYNTKISSTSQSNLHKHLHNHMNNCSLFWHMHVEKSSLLYIQYILIMISTPPLLLDPSHRD